MAPNVTVTQVVSQSKSPAFPVAVWVYDVAANPGIYNLTKSDDWASVLGFNSTAVSNWFALTDKRLTVVATALADMTIEPATELPEEPHLLAIDSTVVAGMDATVDGYQTTLNNMAALLEPHILLATSDDVDVAGAVSSAALLTATNIAYFYGLDVVMLAALYAYYEIENTVLAGFAFPLVGIAETAAVASKMTDLDTLYAGNVNGIYKSQALGKAVWGALTTVGGEILSSWIIAKCIYDVRNLLLPFLLQPSTRVRSTMTSVVDGYLAAKWSLGWFRGSFNNAFTTDIQETSDTSITVNLVCKPVGLLEEVVVTVLVE